MIRASKDLVEKRIRGYLEQVEAGETVIIESGGRPIAEIRPIKSRSSRMRPFGLCAGEFEVPEDFDAPLPEEVLRTFEAR